MQPYFNPTRQNSEINLNTFEYMEDNLNLKKNEDDLNCSKMEDNLDFLKLEDDLKLSLKVNMTSLFFEPPQQTIMQPKTN